MIITGIDRDRDNVTVR